MTGRYDDDDLDEGRDETGSGLRRKLEQEIQKRKDAEAKATQAERDLTFVRAGIKLDDPKTKYFVAGYDGEMEPEKIKAAATEAGFLTEATTTQTPAQQQQNNEGDGTPPAQAQPGQLLTAEQWAALQQEQALYGGMQGATQQQDTSGENHRAGMEKAIQEGGVEAMTAYMRNHGLPVKGDDQ